MKSSYPPLRAGYIPRLFQLLLFTLFGLIVAGIVMGLMMRGGLSTPTLRIATVIQDLLVFIAPAILTAVMVTGRPDRLLETDRCFDLRQLLLAILIMFVSVPAMNALVAWNESVTLPASMSGVEEWMRSSEENARQSVAMLLGGGSPGNLVVSLLIVGLLAGFSEEIFFRGALQRLLASSRLNPHVAIWLTAFIFSAFHMQFYGFFPRLLLGAFFGYLLFRGGSLWLPVAMHALNNAMVVISEWYGKRNPGSMMAGINEVGADSLPFVVCSGLLTILLCVWFFRGGSVRLEAKTQ